jgi:hypothetical protein
VSRVGCSPSLLSHKTNRHLLNDPLIKEMTSVVNWEKLLENMSHWDKDERYMATNDLCTLLNAKTKIDATVERKVCAAVLKQLGMLLLTNDLPRFGYWFSHCVVYCLFDVQYKTR